MVVIKKMENKRKKTIVTALVIILAITIPLAGYVTASYVLNSNHVSGTAQQPATLTLTANNSNVVVGDTLKLTAHLSDNKAGVPIQFYNASTELNPTVNTDSSGNAVVYYAVDTAYDLYAITTHP